MRVHVVIGTRPQYVKWAALEPAFRRAFELTLIDTGQHYDPRLSKVFFDDFKLTKPDLNLRVGSLSSGKQIARMIVGLEQFWEKRRPDLAVVVGDTNSTLAGALAAVKLKVDVGHLEAGIRSFNKQMPEEVNRILTDHVSALLWCPTRTAVANLKREGISRGVFWTGDVTYELFLRMKSSLQSTKVRENYNLREKRFAVMTLHRQKNTTDLDRLNSILRGASRTRLPIIFLAHPRTSQVIRKNKIKLPGNIILAGPLGYLDFLTLVKSAQTVITDSGGLLREAAWLGVPAVVVREETEWPELVSRGWNLLVGADERKICRAVGAPARTQPITGLFGGPANSRKVVRSIKHWWRTDGKKS